MNPLSSRSARQFERQPAIISRHANGLPRTLRLERNPAQDAAYRRLAVTILGLDVANLAAQLAAERRLMPRSRAAIAPSKAA